jgi:hypothetical protein
MQTTAKNIASLIRLSDKFAVIGQQEYRKKDALKNLKNWYQPTEVLNIKDMGNYWAIWV